jgi:hypothetical protein
VRPSTSSAVPYIETLLCGLSGVLAIATVFWPDWIEALTGWEPDHQDGSLEWLIVAALGAICVIFGLLARRSWRRHALVSSGRA